MMHESQGIRVRPLTSALDGDDLVEFVHRLFDAGYDKFYVKVPKGFQPHPFAIDPFPRGHEHYRRPRKLKSAREQSDSERQIRYLKIATVQMRDLIEYPPIALDGPIKGGLESAAASDGLLPIDFKYRKGLLGSLLPNDENAANGAPTEFDANSGDPVVVKILDRRRGQYSYVLHGIRLKDVFVEVSALSDTLESMRASKAETESVGEDLPEDSYGLGNSSPLVYEILCKAYQNRGKARNEVDMPSLVAELRGLNESYGYRKNPKPFNNGRHDFAATLANPTYKYSLNGLSVVDLPAETEEVPVDRFFNQDFINNRLRKALYAACRWSGAMEPRLGDDREKLVELLCGLGFFDREDNDQVQALIFFITGKKYHRNKYKSEFRHMHGDRG